MVWDETWFVEKPGFGTKSSKEADNDLDHSIIAIISCKKAQNDFDRETVNMTKMNKIL